MPSESGVVPAPVARDRRGHSESHEIVSRGHLVVHLFAEPELKPDENDTSCCWRVVPPVASLTPSPVRL
jgi:hypothetical protein